MRVIESAPMEDQQCSGLAPKRVLLLDLLVLPAPPSYSQLLPAPSFQEDHRVVSWAGQLLIPEVSQPVSIYFHRCLLPARSREALGGNAP